MVLQWKTERWYPSCGMCLRRGGGGTEQERRCCGEHRGDIQGFAVVIAPYGNKKQQESQVSPYQQRCLPARLSTRFIQIQH